MSLVWVSCGSNSKSLRKFKFTHYQRMSVFLCEWVCMYVLRSNQIYTLSINTLYNIWLSIIYLYCIKSKGQPSLETAIRKLLDSIFLLYNFVLHKHWQRKTFNCFEIKYSSYTLLISFLKTTNTTTQCASVYL